MYVNRLIYRWVALKTELHSLFRQIVYRYVSNGPNITLNLPKFVCLFGIVDSITYHWTTIAWY